MYTSSPTLTLTLHRGKVIFLIPATWRLSLHIYPPVIWQRYFHEHTLSAYNYITRHSDRFYYINVTTFHLAVIMMILFWQDRLPLYAHLCVYIFILMKGYPVMTLITFDPQAPWKTGDSRNHLRNSYFSTHGYIIFQYQWSRLAFSICRWIHNDTFLSPSSSPSPRKDLSITIQMEI